MFTRRGLSGLTAGIAALAASPAAAAAGGAATLSELQGRLAKLPVRRDFKTVPLVLESTDTWDDAAIREVAAYRGGPRQVWDNKDLASGWTVHHCGHPTALGPITACRRTARRSRICS